MGIINKLLSSETTAKKRPKTVIIKSFHGFSIFNELLELPVETLKDNILIVCCSNESIRRCKSLGLDYIPIQLFDLFYSSVDGSLSSDNEDNIAYLPDDSCLFSFQRMYKTFNVGALNSGRTVLVLDGELCNSDTIHKFIKFRNKKFNKDGSKVTSDTIYLVNNAFLQNEFNRFELIGTLKWMATTSGRDIVDVRIETANNKLPDYSMEIVHLANRVRKNIVSLDVPKNERSYAIEVVGCSDDLKKKIDYNRYVHDSGMVITNDMSLTAYINRTIRRTIYGAKMDKVHIGDKIVSYEDIYGENFFIPRGSLLSINAVEEGKERFFKVTVTSENIIDGLDSEEIKSVDINIDKAFLDKTSDPEFLAETDDISFLKDTIHSLCAYAYSLNVDIAVLNSYNVVTSIFDRFDPMLTESAISTCRRSFKNISVPLYYDMV